MRGKKEKWDGDWWNELIDKMERESAHSLSKLLAYGIVPFLLVQWKDLNRLLGDTDPQPPADLLSVSQPITLDVFLRAN